MKKNNALTLATIIMLLLTSLFTNITYAKTSSISMELDKTKANVGDMIIATIKISNISNFCGYHINIKYDPLVLQAVDPFTEEPFEKWSMPVGGTLLNGKYGNASIAVNNADRGILNFGNTYVDTKDYKASGKPETTGIIGKIGFKVLKSGNTMIKFENAAAMPDAIQGTNLFDWDSEIITGYDVIQPSAITIADPVPVSTPTPSPTPTPGTILPDDAYIALEIDKSKAKVGDIVVATVKANNMTTLAGYQLNIKYDPKVLQAVNPITGEAFTYSTGLVGGELILNKAYYPYQVASNRIDEGVISYSCSYVYLHSYRESGKYESTGVIGKVGFKVLKATDTTVKLQDGGTMPGSIEGTYAFDWHGNTMEGYRVIQPSKISVISEPEPTPTATMPTPTATTPAPTTTPQTPVTTQGRISMVFDKTEAKVGDIITATVRVDNIKNFAGFQVNIKYDPKILEAVDYQTKKAFTKTTMPTGATILINDKYQPVDISANNIANGILNFGKTYSNLVNYRIAGKPEETGIIAKIGFKVLKEGSTIVKFEDTKSMPDAKKGTDLFDWNSERISNYDVIQPGKITIVNATPTPTATPGEETGGGGGAGGGGGPGGGGGGTSPSAKPTATPTPTSTSTATKKPKPTEIVKPDPDIPTTVGIHYSYLAGYPDKLFRPEKSITRAEAAVIFAKLMGANENTEIDYNVSYNDLDKSHWANWAIKFVSYKKLFTGYPDGTFKPNQNITRAEFSTVVFKLLASEKGLKEEKLEKFKFDDSKGHWAQQFIEQLSDLGYINGYPDGTFKPDNNIKRSESVALINRAMGRGPLYGAPQKFEDVPQTHWAFKDIAEGVLDHKFKLDSEGNEELMEIIGNQ
ncbi:hypothetical protein A7W90_17585 [Clostridium sp. Bc-iso-3]|nr:hypothetical protein A7W90_17585 [Clostridium sp. Bc-iso-3]